MQIENNMRCIEEEVKEEGVKFLRIAMSKNLASFLD